MARADQPPATVQLAGDGHLESLCKEMLGALQAKKDAGEEPFGGEFERVGPPVVPTVDDGKTLEQTLDELDDIVSELTGEGEPPPPGEDSTAELKGLMAKALGQLRQMEGFDSSRDPKNWQQVARTTSTGGPRVIDIDLDLCAAAEDDEGCAAALAALDALPALTKSQQ
eukprot:TRINITY_DN1607_c0_g4_i1.p1 TRINITY_DN1607_c0_g4~~TRINITY_DN1607_c0_g4_i1.p1  ORF type:complete len:169 (+),score=22.37 TRINITY_DN1607_c0_g4_i1:73-579(+)